MLAVALISHGWSSFLAPCLQSPLPASPSPASSPHTCGAGVPGTLKSLNPAVSWFHEPGLGGGEPGHVCRVAVLGAVVSHGQWCHTAPLCVWEQLEASGRVLQLDKALPGDAALYTCVATNAAGEAQQHTRLNVHGNAA